MPDLTKPERTYVAILEGDGRASVLRVPTAYDPAHRRVRPVVEPPPGPGRRVFWRGAELLADGTTIRSPWHGWGCHGLIKAIKQAPPEGRVVVEREGAGRVKDPRSREALGAECF